jgi:protocatechuate 3,4-dioxygenase beta subunit
MPGLISGTPTATVSTTMRGITCAGTSTLETVRPLGYQMRASHIHVKVRANESSPVLTTQLFFPGEKKNETDPIFEEKTLMNVAEMQDSQRAIFDFVVEVK